ncbi:MAG: HEAT repeat domain-containing protein [Thermoleophilia bacterium]
MARKPDNISPADLDFERPETLVRLSLVSRIDALRALEGGPQSRAQIAEELDLEPSQLSKRLSAEALAKESNDAFVHGLQGYLQVQESSLGETGSELVAFRELILSQSTSSAIGLQVPATFFRPLAKATPTSLEDVLLAGAALVAVREQASSVQMAKQLRTVSGTELVEEVIERLVVASSIPHREFRVTLALTAQLREWAVPTVHRFLARSPVAGRSVRILTRMLRALPAGRRPDADEGLWEQISQVLRAIPRPLDLDPARGFFEEALRFTPGWRSQSLGSRRRERTWEEPWIPERLRETGEDSSRPTRQRAFAALCLSEGDADDQAAALRILDQFRHESRDDPSGGLTYAAQSIARIFEWRASGLAGKQADCWTGTDAERHLRAVVSLRTGSVTAQKSRALDELPVSVREACLHLSCWALLSPDITQRRTACDALTAAGAGHAVCTFLGQVITAPACPGFLREVGAAVLGYLGDKNALEALVQLAGDADERVETRRAAIMALAEVRHDPTQAALSPLTSALKDRALSAAAVFAVGSRARQDAQAARSGAAPSPDGSLLDALATARAGTADGQVAALARWAEEQVLKASEGDYLPVSPLAFVSEG